MSRKGVESSEEVKRPSVTTNAPVGPPCQGQMWVHPVVCTPNNSLSYVHFVCVKEHLYSSCCF